jgi:hypothetical protein
MTWENSTISEIRKYYLDEFVRSFQQIPEFITGSKPKQIAISFPKPYPVKKDDVPPRDFIRRDIFESQSSITSWQGGDGSIIEFIKNPAKNDPIASDHQLASPELVDVPPIPEAVYYSTDFHDRNWVLIIDIDAKDIASKEMANNEVSESEEIINSEPEGFPYRFDDIDTAIDYAFEVKKYLESSLDTSKTQVVYSGQGAHVYLYDPDPMYRYSKQNRSFIIDKLSHELGIPIDEQVTTDVSRVIRLPYSLHADVSRIVTPISDPDFDYRNKAMPEFLKQSQEQG